MRPVAIAILAAFAAASPALAQDAAGSNKHHGAPKKSAEAPKVKANETDYKAALDRLPAQKYDPWGTTRPAGDKR